jgi:RHS repeat-associated protein
MKPLNLLALSALIFVFGAILGFPQAANEQGIKPYGSYHGGAIDSVNVSNGHLELRVPVLSYPQRGSSLKLNFIARFHNAVWNEHKDCVPTTSICIHTWEFDAQPGVQLVNENGSPFVDQQLVSGGNTQNPVYSYSVRLADESQHPLGNLSGTIFETVNATGIKWDSSTQTVTMPNGTRYVGIFGSAPIQEDTNGNQIVFNGASVTDTMGRTIPPTTSTQDYSGCTGSLATSSATLWTVPGANGGSNTFKFCYAEVKIYIHHWTLQNTSTNTYIEPNAFYSMLQSIVLPDQTSWTFDYSQPDSNGVNWGDLAKVTYPTGGSIAYTWGHFQGCHLPAGAPGSWSGEVSKRTVDSHDGKPSHDWLYTAGSAAGQIIVRDPLLNDTVHTFTDLNTSCSLYETKTEFYSGEQSGGTLMQTVTTDYSWGRPLYFVPINVVPIRRTTTWANGQAKKTEYSYDSGFTYGGSTNGIYGKETAVKEFDYGPGNPGGLLKSTITSYRWQDPAQSSYKDNNVLDVPSLITVQDGSANNVSQTTILYDGAIPGASSILTSHEANPVNANVRGNATSVSLWLSGNTVATPNCPVAVSNGNLTTTKTYLDTGMVSQTKDACLQQTNFQFSSLYAGAYLTSSCDALNHCTTMDYDFSTGATTGVTDPNAKKITYAYDSIGRVTTISYPDGGQTNAFYPDATTVEVKKLQDSTTNVWIDSYSYFDGLLRPSQARLVDPQGDVYTKTAYDAIGRISQSFNPTRCNPPGTNCGEATWGYTSYIYDAIGRITTETSQDGSTTVSSFNGNTMTVTDQAGKQRRNITNGLGRLMEVDEPPPDGSLPLQNDHATLQTDGNFVLYNPASSALWSTGTYGTNASVISMQDDANLVLYVFKWQAGVYVAPTGGTIPYDGCRVGSSLFAGQVLASGSCLESASGRYMLLMQSDGNLFIYDRSAGQVTWAANTYGHPGAVASLQSDGNFVVYDSNGVGIWSSGTYGTFSERLDMGDDGRIIIYKSAWNSGTSNGSFNWPAMAHPACDIGTGTGWTGVLGTAQCFVSPNGRYELVMQSDGNLVIYDRSVTPNTALWSTGTTVTIFSPGVALQTLYAYDALGNLFCVEQHGSASTGTGCPATPPGPTDSPIAPDPNNQWRRRLFAYDSLSRLRWSSNPESGVITYSYDGGGSLLQKTSPAPNQTGSATQTVSYCYDALNRVTGKGYGAQSCPLSVPIVSYGYDSGTNATGRLVSMVDQAGTASYTYDVMGRLASEIRPIASISRAASFTYNLVGAVKTLTYPSGRILTYIPDSAGRLASAVDGNGTQYVNSATYYPSGAEYQRFMPNIYFLTTLNPRLQVSGFYSDNGKIASFFLNKTYGYGQLHQNNGNVMSITNNKDSNRTQTFAYDALNRIVSGSSSANTGAYSWGENYSIDAWGNLQISPMSGKDQGGTFQLAGNAQNRPTGLAYDAAGNLMSYLSSTYIYDQENRLSSTAGTNYTYDGTGERVLKLNTSTGTAVKRSWSVGGHTLAEGDGAGNLTAEYIYFGGERVARIDLPANTVHYYLSDHLGSTSIVISAAGNIEEESDYYPFGTELVVASQGSNRYKFTGKERDVESGLDNFGARYNFSTFGRFITPDPVHILKQKLADPQQWNMYAYVRNNPLRFIDPKGKWIELIGNDKERDALLTALQKAVGDKTGYLYDNAVTTTDADGNKTTKHFVGIHAGGADGSGPEFKNLNAVANKVNGIIGDTRRGASIGFQAPGRDLGPAPFQSPARTPLTTDWANVRISSGQFGYQQGELQSDGRDHSFTLADIISHELGHVDAVWYHGATNDPGDPISRGDAVRIENEQRKLNGEPLRTGHGTPGDVQLDGVPF